MAPSQIWIIFPPRIRGETYKQIFDFPPAIFNGSFFFKGNIDGLVFFFWGGRSWDLMGFQRVWQTLVVRSCVRRYKKTTSILWLLNGWKKYEARTSSLPTAWIFHDDWNTMARTSKYTFTSQRNNKSQISMSMSGCFINSRNFLQRTCKKGKLGNRELVSCDSGPDSWVQHKHSYTSGQRMIIPKSDLFGACCRKTPNPKPPFGEFPNRQSGRIWKVTFPIWK